MVEVGHSNLIEDIEYLENYDLVDIPGLSESSTQEKSIENLIIKTTKTGDEEKKENITGKFITIEEEMVKYKPKKEKNYFSEIFNIIKNYINNGIIVFSMDNYEHTDNYRIIGKFQKIIGKPIENFLILLNKIDKSKDEITDLKLLRNKIMEYFPNQKEFNFVNNTIVACCTLQLENEVKMENNFKNLLYYHYLNLIMETNKKNSLSLTKDANPFNTNFIDKFRKLISKLNSSIKKEAFIDAINNIIKDKNLTSILNEIKEIIKLIKENHRDNFISLGGIKEEDFNEENIKQKFEELKENNNEEEEDDIIDIEEQEGNIIILYIYSEFKKKKNYR